MSDAREAARQKLMGVLDAEWAEDRCESCGEILSVGAWPYCPHGRGDFTNIPDDVPGGFVVENGFDEPTRFYSHSEHRKALAERGLEIRAKYAGPHDKIMSNWAAGSVNLQSAEEFVRRHYNTETRAAERQRLAEEFPITVTDVPKENPIIAHLDRYYPKDSTP